MEEELVEVEVIKMDQRGEKAAACVKIRVQNGTVNPTCVNNQ